VKAFAVASEPVAAAAANRTLKDGGTATDAILAGFLAAAADRPGVLLGSVQMLLAGPGIGARAFDGRPRQPGRAVPRPRGFREGEPIPPAAFVAVPTSLGAIALAHAYDGDQSMARLARPAAEHARAAGALGRERVLKRIAAVGAAALREAVVARPLLAAASRAEGGLLTDEDLATVRPGSGAPAVLDAGGAQGERRALVVPWDPPGSPCRVQEIVAAGDARGVLSVLAYGPDDEGVPIPDLELLAPRDAEPVRRGVTRARPGNPIACPAPIAIAIEQSQPFLALGVASGVALPLAELTAQLSEVPLGAGAMLRALADAARTSRGVGIVRGERGQVSGVAIGAAAGREG
jgi:gamma-glutamyltranspeptidase/glutathione hydrolase